MLEVMEIADLAAKLGITYSKAYLIAQLVNGGLTVASIISIVSGVGSIIGVYMFAIKRKIIDLGMRATVAW
ncbi:hypothetical protein QTG56_07355 [Rossellomorea sp. AcN35-11]|nr:hypothetical protein [Rossellomorea aquimaris]WJV30831.1 hypothetical protein QTG56_07355 [Rossellomorea sp. AcN35-11]